MLFQIEYKCYGPSKCARTKRGKRRCAGFEGDTVYCYGNNKKCLPDDCSVDSDCSKYTTESPKYTKGGRTICQQNDPNSKYPNSWQHDACHCRDGIINSL